MLTDEVIQLDGITKDYGDFRALSDVTLRVRGGITGLLGPNGAGKSTLIKVLLGLLRVSCGSGRLLGCELGKQNLLIRDQVGYMPEDDCFLFGFSGIETVQFAAQMSRFPATEGLRRAHETLDFCGIAQERYRQVDTYSTGMRQKLRFAQAIVHDPKLLILDEPTSGLDPEERQAMLNRIDLMSQVHGKAIILCTHILPDVQAVCDDVVILDRGRVLLTDALENLNQPKVPATHLRIRGDRDQFITHLAEQGLQAEAGRRAQLTVYGDPTETAQLIWSAAQSTAITIESMGPSINSLEEVFMTAIRGADNGRS